MLRASRIGDIPLPNRYTVALATFLAASAITPNVATATPVHKPADLPAQAVVKSSLQPEPTLFPKITNTPPWNGKEGIELTNSRAVYIGLVPGDTELVKVPLPDSLEAKQNNITFVGIRWAGQKVISRCAFVSNWEVQQKYHKDFLPPEADNPCGMDEMNVLKTKGGTGHVFNGRGKVDGAESPVLDTLQGDKTFYRNYAPAKDTKVGTSENQRLFFQDPVILDNGTKVQMINHIYYRYLSNDNKANFLRLDPAEILGATIEEVNLMSLWGTGDSVIAKPAFGGPDKPENAVRGHNPISGAT